MLFLRAGVCYDIQMDAPGKCGTTRPGAASVRTQRPGEDRLPTFRRYFKLAEFKYEIVDMIGVLSENAKGWTKELNLISWNEREPKYDIREWSPDHSKMGKGVTITKEELYSLKELLMELEIEAPDDEPAL
ncbi:hypothetical protein HMPREF0262_01288 [Clostridium sp. ATCC 29733]|nr:hypothetical protein HMPREF0262_01288 [Clostridium sp. ATCC 29733]